MISGQLSLALVALVHLGFVFTCHGYTVNTEQCNYKIDYFACINELGRMQGGPNSNSASCYEKAIARCVIPSKDITTEAIQAWPLDLQSEERVTITQWLSGMEPAIEYLKAGAGKSHYWLDYKGNLLYELPLTSKMRKATRPFVWALCLKAKFNAANAEFEEAFSEIMACYKFGTHLTGPRSVLEQSAGIATCMIAVDTAFQVLDRTVVPTDRLRDFQKILDRSGNSRVVVNFKFEEFAAKDVLQKIFSSNSTERQDNQSQFSAEEVKLPDDILIMRSDAIEYYGNTWRTVGCEEANRLIDEVFLYLNKVNNLSPFDLNQRREKPNEALWEMTGKNPVVRSLIAGYAFDRVIKISRRANASTDALITTLALLRYRNTKGRYPLALKDLIDAGLLSRIPPDPYSNKALVYKLTESDFILYSVGADFDDDGGISTADWGEAKEGGDMVFWPVKAKP